MKDKIVKEWFERGEKDFNGAKKLFEVNNYEVAVFLIHQAVEKYLKGYLIFHGWELKKIHDIYILLSEAVNFNDFFKGFLDIGKKLTAFYYEERYPPGPLPEILEKEAEEILEQAEKIITFIKEEVKL